MKCSTNECPRQYYAKGYCKLHYEQTRRERGVPTMSRVHNIWSCMKQRCYYPKRANFANYGGRGIVVCDDWREDFTTFYNWALSNGYRPDLTLDRIDNNGNYEPSNCRWITIQEQQSNRRSNHLLTIDGVTKTSKDWAKSVGISPSTVRTRLFRGWDDKRAVFSPARGSR